MALKGKDSSGWKDASAVYGKDASGWLYAKEAWAKNASGWQRAWTDCRQHDAGGRDWTAAAGVTEYQGSCGNRESRVRTDYSKTGCTSYSRYTAWVSSPDCNSSCFTASTSSYYTGTCQSRTITERTTYTANAGSNCTTYYVDGTPVASPTCGGNPPGPCWTEMTCNYAGQTNVTFAGEVFDYVYDFGGGSCWAARDSVPGYIVFFYLCGTTQGIYEAYVG